MKKTGLFFTILTLLTIFILDNAVGQTVIRGKITDKESNDPIIGANVVEYDKNDRVVSGTISDLNGNYVLQVTYPDAEIRYSFIGSKSQTIKINSRSIIDILLEPEAINLEEAIIVAKKSDTDPLTGVSIRDRTTASVKVDMAQFRNASGLSVDDALQGQVTGLDIMSSGAPGSGSSIVIRGLGSLGNSKPLIVVDGIAQNITIGSDFDLASSNQEDIGALLNIAPQDIKSIEVLKDATSTAVWGSKGADGVLLIETNRGSKGKTSFNFQYKHTLKKQPPPIPMLNGDEYITMQLDELQNALGIFEVPDEIAYNTDYIDFYNYSANTDWINEITRLGSNKDYYFKMSGGGEKTTFFTSLNYSNELGTTLNEGFKRLSTRINLDYTLSKQLSFSVNFDYTNSYKDGNYIFKGVDINNDGINDNVNIRQMAYMKAPNMSIFKHDQFGNRTNEYFTPINSYQGSGIEYFNPAAIANLSQNDESSNILQNSFVLRYKMNKWINFNETISFQYSNQIKSIFLPYTAIGADWLDSRINQSQEGNSVNDRLSARSQVIMTPVVNSTHSLITTILYEFSQNSGEWTQINGTKGPSLDITDPAAGQPIASLSSGSSKSRAMGALGSVNYKLKDKYIASFILRADANSSFGINNRWGLFPSASVGWRFSKEPLFESLKFVNDGKITLGYGQAGKEPGNPYDRFGIFNNANPSKYITSPAVIQTQIQLANLKWQTVESWNLGWVSSHFDNRLYISFDLYKKITSDILWRNYSIPESSGFNLLKFFNGGKLENKGWETSFRYDVLRKSKFKLAVNFNISHNLNSFLEFPANFNNFVGSTIANGVYPRMAQLGQPVGSFYGFKYLGVYPTNSDAVAKDAAGNVKVDANGNPIQMTFANGYKFQGGDARYDDINHDGVIDINDVVYLGDSNPLYTGGMGFNTSWKRIRLSCQFLFREGFDIVNEIALETEGVLDKNNQSKAVLRRWRKEGDNEPNMLPRAYMDSPANNLGSDRYVEPGDFLRLNNLSLEYSLDKKFVERIGLNMLEVGINLRKIWTLTNYSGQDPEISQTVDDPFWFGTDNGITPTPAVYSFYVNIMF